MIKAVGQWRKFVLYECKLCGHCEMDFPMLLLKCPCCGTGDDNPLTEAVDRETIIRKFKAFKIRWKEV